MKSPKLRWDEGISCVHLIPSISPRFEADEEMKEQDPEEMEEEELGEEPPEAVLRPL